MDQAIESGAIKIDGNKEAFTDFLGLLDTYSFGHIVAKTPSLSASAAFALGDACRSSRGPLLGT
jgi:hypothetical protein